jgi:UPF0148 protein
MMNSDENVKKIARFLENGGTMLANHCENCSAPLFRFKGDIICPICSGIDAVLASKKAVAASSEKPKQKSERAEKGEQTEKSERAEKIERAEKKKVRDISKPTISDDDEESRLRWLILRKITAVAEDMQNETDSRRIFESLEIIEKGLELMDRL